MLFVLCDIIAEGCEELPADPTCTDMKCKWTDPKGANCETWMVGDLHIYKAKFGTEPSPKSIKPSVRFADKVFKCDISQDKNLEKKLKLKNDIFIANQRDSIPPILRRAELPSLCNVAFSINFLFFILPWPYYVYPGARGFFLVGGDKIEWQSRDGKSRSGEKKTSGTNG